MIRLDSMRVFSTVAGSLSFTGAGRQLDMPKQTVSRRVAELEASLGVRLLERTTRSVRLTEAGRAYAERCEEVVRLADEAHAALTQRPTEASGRLRIAADRFFAETYLAPVLTTYARQFPEVHVDVVLATRRVDLAEEGFDLAVRVGPVDETAGVITSLGAAAIAYVAAPAYVQERGRPATPEALLEHDIVAQTAESGAVRWPFLGERGPRSLALQGRVRANSFRLVRRAALAGLGVALFPAPVAERDIAAGRLEALLQASVPSAGEVHLVTPAARALVPRIRAFVLLARDRLAGAPWRGGELPG